MKSDTRHHLRRWLGLTALVALGLLSAATPGQGDDRELLRFQGSQPYLFIHLDTSASMNLRFGVDGDTPTAGFGDDPDSRIYAAKEALFRVFENVNDVNFGFASFNQDTLYVPSTHWLYYYDSSLPGGWPLEWPTPDPDGLASFVDTIDQDTDDDGISDSGDGIPDSWVNDVEGDALVFGATFTQGSGTPLPAGSCSEPLDLDDPLGRQRANTYAKLGAGGNETTYMWITSAGETYVVLVRRPSNKPDGNPNNEIGADKLHVIFELYQAEDEPCGDDYELVASANLRLRLDPKLNEFLFVDQAEAPLSQPIARAPDSGGGSGGGSAVETYPAFWSWSDALNSATCDDDQPFTGQGWEGNYDGSYISPSDPDPSDNDRDRFYPVSGGGSVDLKYNPTTVSTFGAALDRGDMLPFDWQTDNKTEFLQRLAPNWPEETPDFGVAGHLEAGFGADAGAYVSRIPGRGPLVAAGESPIGKALLDFRCWYSGPGAVKCKSASQTAFFEAGWSQIACTYDSDYGCRKPFQILISDGVDTCGGENPSADVAALNSQHGVTTWVLNLGDPTNCQTGLLGSIARPGGGECIDVANKEDLRRTIEDILGQIREEARAFASAAVPSVQATADQSIYVTNFVPLNDRSVWDGHINAFLKPLPLDEHGRPDTTDENFLWDAGQVLRDSQYDAANPVDGADPGKRRVYYSRQTTSGDWPNTRRLFEPTTDGTDESVRYDLWRGLRFIASDVADGDLTDAQETSAETGANGVISETLALKSATLIDTGEVITYLLGDVFHANPVVVGTPVNPTYFAMDLGADQDEDCRADDTVANANRGYRCFLLRQRFRRKALIVASNDGFVHAFNSGIYDRTTETYSNGTGHELWAFTPRTAMPSLVDLATDTSHKYTVDGNPAVADVFIDPVHNGSPTLDERLWRTVMVGGMRRGGNAYYALDITQPDPIDSLGPLSYAPDASPGLPDAGVPTCTNGGAGCGPTAYPAQLWEFSDSTDNSFLTGVAPELPVALDEDLPNTPGYGQPDLSFTWSAPVIGRVLMCKEAGTDCTGATLNDLEDRYVAIFGGGLDPLDKVLDDPDAGDWIYMVDIETGKVLYKRQVVGAVPSALAPVDTTQDGYFDRIYFGTTAGRLYRVDLGADSTGNYPKLSTMTVEDVNRVARDLKRIPLTDGNGNPVWEPRIIFDANFDDSAVLAGIPRAIYHRPSVVFITRLGLYGLVFGTGDREDLWNASQQEGRFYVFVDDTDQLAPAALPLNEGNFERITVDSAPQANDLLLTRSAGERGWYLVLEPNEKVITDAFSLSGVTFFSSYRPETALTDEDGDPIDGGGTCGDKGYEQDTDNLCSKTGNSRIFIVNTTNANPFIADPETSSLERHMTVASFVSSPFTERSTNKNEDADGGDGGSTADDLTQSEEEVMEALKSLFPTNCKFASYGIDIKSITAETAVQRIARVPVCLVEKNWKDF
jgi:hypothetical protein